MTLQEGRSMLSTDPKQLLLNVDHELYAQHVANGKSLFSAWREVTGNHHATNSLSAIAWARNPTVAARIRELIGEKMALAGVTADKTKRELARIAFSDVRNIFDEHGDLLPPHLMDDDTARSVQSIQMETVWRGNGKGAEQVKITKIKMAPKMEALAILSKHFKIVGDSPEDGINNLANALADRLNEAKRRTSQDVEDAQVIDAAPAAIAHEPTFEDLLEGRVDETTLAGAPDSSLEEDEDDLF